MVIPLSICVASRNIIRMKLFFGKEIRSFPFLLLVVVKIVFIRIKIL